MLRKRMDGETSFVRMRDRDGGWVRGDVTTAGALWTNTDWSRHNPLASDSDVATQRRWLTKKGAARNVATWANDERRTKVTMAALTDGGRLSRGDLNGEKRGKGGGSRVISKKKMRVGGLRLR
uniref:Uncharacterized protein n=2 Tax=Cucumis melo TaxID=3656 RepID=A0A9I9D1B1_CUCME